MVHAVNPFGFAWLRRVNEDNVDLNRNFLDHTAPHPENPDYDMLYDVLNPQSFDDATIEAARERMRRFEADAGPEAAYRAMSGGQYVHPRGVQFGTFGEIRDVRVRDAAFFRSVHNRRGPFVKLGGVFFVAADAGHDEDVGILCGGRHDGRPE